MSSQLGGVVRFNCPILKMKSPDFTISVLVTVYDSNNTEQWEYISSYLEL